MAKKLRIGFVGAGGISHVHMTRLAGVKQAEVVALTDPDKKAIERFHGAFPASAALPVYKDYRAMIEHEALDATVILSPHTLHYEQIHTSIDCGLHVLTEKPMVSSIREAKELIAFAKKKNRVLMIAYQRHFEPTFRYMREQIAKGALGDVQYVQAVLSQEYLRLVQGTWRLKKALSGGGQINDSGSHVVDIMMWVTGLKVKKVFAVMDNFKTEVDINSALTMEFENGAMGNLAIIGNAPGWYEDHTIVGSKGAFYLRQGVGLIQQDALGRPVKVRLPKVTKDPSSNFVDSILGKASPEVPPECGLRTIEVTEAAWQSAASGKPVRVP